MIREHNWDEAADKPRFSAWIAEFRGKNESEEKLPFCIKNPFKLFWN
jgi:hypothetical protein